MNDASTVQPLDGIPDIPRAPIWSTPVRSGAAVIIPAFQEAATIAEVVRRVRAVLPGARVIVVDDGCTDGTADLARKAGARVDVL